MSEEKEEKGRKKVSRGRRDRAQDKSTHERR
jgi:hypothetical protein